MSPHASQQLPLFEDIARERVGGTGLDLPDTGRPSRAPYAKGSTTSKAAADAQLPVLGKLQRLYLAALYEYGGLTDHAAAKVLDRPLSSINARRNELKNRVRDSGRTALSPYGRDAVVWELNTKGE